MEEFAYERRIWNSEMWVSLR